MTMFDPARGAVQDPSKEPDDRVKPCARCGHRYGSHGSKGCQFCHGPGAPCPCKAFRKATK